VAFLLALIDDPLGPAQTGWIVTSFAGLLLACLIRVVYVQFQTIKEQQTMFVNLLNQKDAECRSERDENRDMVIKMQEGFERREEARDLARRSTNETFMRAIDSLQKALSMLEKQK
jgi:hypothetical protein